MKPGCCNVPAPYWVSTRTYIAECPGGTGPNPRVEVTRQYTSHLSMEHADQMALQLAKNEAEAELRCHWESTQCVQPPCGEWYDPVCATRTSTESQEDADAQALSAANELAEQFCEGTVGLPFNWSTAAVNFSNASITFADTHYHP